MFAAMCCFCGGWLVGSAGLAMGQYWLVLLGYGLLGGIGWGIGYISPVSTLIKIVPRQARYGDRIGDHGIRWRRSHRLSVVDRDARRVRQQHGGHRQDLPRPRVGVRRFHDAGLDVGAGAEARLETAGLDSRHRPTAGSVITGGQVSAANAIKTPQFWLLWVVLCFNVTAGIGILGEGVADLCSRDYFPGAEEAAAAVTAAAAGYVALLSLANMLGRIGWSSLSDKIGRKNVYRMYLGVGRAVVSGHHADARTRTSWCSLICTLLILSFYGAGFATGSGLSARPVRHLSGRRDPRPVAHRMVCGGDPWADHGQRDRRQPVRTQARAVPRCTRCPSRS